METDLGPEEPMPEIRLPELSKPVDWALIFGNDRPVHLEIGSGSGHWTGEFARLHPELNLLAVEKFIKQVRRTVDKIRRRALPNVRVLRCDGAYFLSDYAPTASLEAIHLYFPDPWFKKRHWKRRIVRPDIAAHFARTLRPGGTLQVKTDITAYHEVILEVLGAATELEKAEERRLDQEYPRDAEGHLPRGEQIASRDLPELMRLTSNYERKALAAGHPIHYTRWVRRQMAGA